MADGDLDLWARLAEDGLPLAGGGTVRTRWADRGVLPHRAHSALVGPDGWLARFGPGALLTVRLTQGALAVASLREPVVESLELATRAEGILSAAMQAAADRLPEFAVEVQQDRLALPGVLLDEIIADLLSIPDHPFDLPLPPLSVLLMASGGLEMIGRTVALAGSPRSPAEVSGFDPPEILQLVLARHFLAADEDPLYSTDGDDFEDDELSGFLELLDSPAVLDVIADDAELEPLTPTLLDGLRAVATSPQQRAVVSLLAARCCEGGGEPIEAEPLIQEALAADPRLVPALLDAGDYAATRGDAVRAEAHLRATGMDRDNPLRQALRPLCGPPPGAVSRNRPCPCGSGRKYKACCQLKQAHPLPARAPLAYARLGFYAARAANVEVLESLLPLVEPGAARLTLDLAIFDDGLLDDYLDERGQMLPADERELFEEWRDTPLDAYEVTDVRPGADVTLRSLSGDAVLLLSDRALSADVQRLDVLLARPLDDGAGPRLLAAPYRVDRMRRQQLLELLAGDYESADVAGFFGPQPAPRLQNREGHALVLCTSSYQVPEPEDAWERLAADLEDDSADRLVAMHPIDRDERVLAGSISRDGDRFTVEANSIERLRTLQQLLMTAAPTARHIAESTVPAERALAEHQADGGRQPAPTFSAPDPPPEQAAAVLEAFIRDNEQRWVDSSIPALGGRTPREAMAQGGPALAELRALLDDLQSRSREVPGGMDIAQIRTALGLRDTTS